MLPHYHAQSQTAASARRSPRVSLGGSARPAARGLSSACREIKAAGGRPRRPSRSFRGGYHGHYHCCSTKEGLQRRRSLFQSEARPRLLRLRQPGSSIPRADSFAWIFGRLSVVSVCTCPPDRARRSGQARPSSAFLDEFMPVLKKPQGERGREFVLCGDWNIAHTRKSTLEKELARKKIAKKLRIPPREAGRNPREGICPRDRTPGCRSRKRRGRASLWNREATPL